MTQSNSQTTRELVRLGADFASIDIRNSHVTCSILRKESQIPDRRNFIITYPNWNNSHDEGTITGATILQILYSLILDSSKYITFSDAGQLSTRMRCYFHHVCSHFIDYFNDPVTDDAVTSAGDFLFQ